MDGATKQISEYIRKKGFNLSEISRKTCVPYMALYDSLSNEKRDRDLRVDEFLALCTQWNFIQQRGMCRKEVTKDDPVDGKV